MSFPNVNGLNGAPPSGGASVPPNTNTSTPARQVGRARGALRVARRVLETITGIRLARHLVGRVRRGRQVAQTQDIQSAPQHRPLPPLPVQNNLTGSSNQPSVPPANSSPPSSDSGLAASLPASPVLYDLGSAQQVSDATYARADGMGREEEEFYAVGDDGREVQQNNPNPQKSLPNATSAGPGKTLPGRPSLPPGHSDLYAIPGQSDQDSSVYETLVRGQAASQGAIGNHPHATSAGPGKPPLPVGPSAQNSDYEAPSRYQHPQDALYGNHVYADVQDVKKNPYADVQPVPEDETFDQIEFAKK